jgi:hypothetical protein
METKAKPILMPLMIGEKTTLTRAKLKIVAQWFTKYAMVMEWADYSRANIFYTKDERSDLAMNGHIPAQTYVWLARYRGSRPSWGCSLDLTYTTSPDIPPFPGIVTTLVIYQMALQNLCLRAPPKFELVSDPDFQRSTRMVWPRPKPLQWPLSRHLTDSGLKPFGEYWADPDSGGIGCPEG